jgi:hypothetical protein
MAKKDGETKESSSIVEEIEQQLEQALAKRKEEVERELEERIKKEKEEAQKRIDQINKELTEEKDALSKFKILLAEFESNKSDLKKQIKEHIDKAISFQTEIETLTGNTLEELKKVRELNLKLEELQKDTGQKVTDMRDKLEEKFGIVTEVPETEWDETEINLDYELDKLKRIKELLNNKGPSEEEVSEEGTEPVEPGESMEETPEEESTEAVPGEEAKEGPESEPEEAVVEEGNEEAQSVEEVTEEQKGEESQPEDVSEAGKEEESEGPEEEAQQPVDGGQKEQEELETGEEKGEQTFQETFEKLESFRKGTRDENNGEVSYFEHEDKIVLDGEFLVATLNNSFEEAKKMYIKLSQTESPKDQFFIKQEIIKQQETLRKVMLRSIRLCEKDNCSLPDFTKEILNLDVLKTVLEKVSMENWSNQDDFASFDNYSKELKEAFYSRITPPAAYLESIMKQLSI